MLRASPATVDFTSQARSTPASAGSPARGSSFREILAETLADAAHAERALDRGLAGVTKRTTPEDLIVLQAAVYRASRTFELLSKVVDKSAGAVRQALQSSQGG